MKKKKRKKKKEKKKGHYRKEVVPFSTFEKRLFGQLYVNNTTNINPIPKTTASQVKLCLNISWLPEVDCSEEDIYWLVLVLL